MHYGYTNKITFTLQRNKIILIPLTLQQVWEDEIKMKEKLEKEKIEKKKETIEKKKSWNISWGKIIGKEILRRYVCIWVNMYQGNKFDFPVPKYKTALRHKSP